MQIEEMELCDSKSIIVLAKVDEAHFGSLRYATWNFALKQLGFCFLRIGQVMFTNALIVDTGPVTVLTCA